MFETLTNLFKTENTNSSKPQESNISVRSPEDIEGLEKLVELGPVTFILVHADWCGPCQNYKPIWSELENAPGRKANMAMIHHDMVEHSPLLKKAKIPGFPTVLKVFPDGKIEEYKEDNKKTNAVPNIRDKETMISELRSIPVSSVLKNSVLNNIDNPLVVESPKISLNMRNLAKNAQSLKSTPINYSKLTPLQSTPLNPMKTFQPFRPVSMPISQVQPIPPAQLGPATPIMKGGALYTALTSALTKAGPASLLFATSQMMPTKKNTGSNKRLTRKASKTQKRKSKSKSKSKSRR